MSKISKDIIFGRSSNIKQKFFQKKRCVEIVDKEQYFHRNKRPWTSSFFSFHPFSWISDYTTRWYPTTQHAVDIRLHNMLLISDYATCCCVNLLMKWAVADNYNNKKKKWWKGSSTIFFQMKSYQKSITQTLQKDLISFTNDRTKQRFSTKICTKIQFTASNLSTNDKQNAGCVHTQGTTSQQTENRPRLSIAVQLHKQEP